MSAENQVQDAVAPEEKLGIMPYFSLVFAIIFFSGLLASKDWYGVFDFTTINGGFGKVVANATLSNDTLATAMSNFRGKGGSGAIDGFMFALGLVPTVMFALASITIFEHYGALKAARVLLTPILRPLLGIPGTTSLALIASLQSTDGGAALTRQLYDEGQIDDRELKVFATFMMTADAAITNFLGSGAPLFALVIASSDPPVPAVPVTLGLCLGVVLVGKIVAANVMRFILWRFPRLI